MDGRKEGREIKNNRYLILIIINIIFGLTILFLLYSHININNQTIPTGEQVSPENQNAGILEENVIINGDFEQGGLGWKNHYAVREEDGNHYVINNHSWQIKQDLDLAPGTAYQVRAATKKGTAVGPARITFVFFDSKGNKLPEYRDIQHMHRGNGWEEINEILSTPTGAAKTRIYLLTDDEKGYHCFDNIQVTPTENN